MEIDLKAEFQKIYEENILDVLENLEQNNEIYNEFTLIENQIFEEMKNKFGKEIEEYLERLLDNAEKIKLYEYKFIYMQGMKEYRLCSIYIDKVMQSLENS